MLEIEGSLVLDAPLALHFVLEQVRVVSGLPGAFYSICCLGVSTILESEKIVTTWPTND